VELVENGWSLKHIHRLIVRSAAYRRTSSVAAGDENAAQAAKLDSENRLYWRGNRRRLEGEAIRDAMLQVAGELNLQMHGPSARPALPPGVSDRYAWEPDEDPTQRNRRSIYVFVKRNLRYPIFEAFDQPDLHQSCARRAVTITAPQSLLLLNSELTLDLARGWAERLHSQHADTPRELIRTAYRSAFAREASEEEIDAALRFLGEQSRLVAEHDGADFAVTTGPGGPAAERIDIEAVADFCHAVFNSNEFISVD